MAIAPSPGALIPALPPAVIAAPQPAVRVPPVAQPGGQETQSATAHPRDQNGGRQQRPESGLAAAVEELNRSMRAWSTQLRFEVNRDANRVIVQVIDADSGEVVKTIPAESVVRAAELIASQPDEGSTGIDARA